MKYPFRQHYLIHPGQNLRKGDHRGLPVKGHHPKDCRAEGVYQASKRSSSVRDLFKEQAMFIGQDYRSAPQFVYEIKDPLPDLGNLPTIPKNMKKSQG